MLGRRNGWRRGRCVSYADGATCWGAGLWGGERPPDAVVGEFSVVLPVAPQPAAQQPVATILTPSLFLAAVQDGQDRNVGPLPHLMALAPDKLPQFLEKCVVVVISYRVLLAVSDWYQLYQSLLV